MSNALVSHNLDIGRLVDKGYAVAFDDLPYLIVRDIYYLDSDRRLQTGAIVSKFVDLGQDRIVQEDHQIFFAGSMPHDENGKAVPNLGGGPTTLALSEKSKDVVVRHRSQTSRSMTERRRTSRTSSRRSTATPPSSPALPSHCMVQTRTHFGLWIVGHRIRLSRSVIR